MARGPQLKNEEWRECSESFLNGKYWVSNYGRVKRLLKRIGGGDRWVLVKPYYHHAGPRLNAKRYGKQKSFHLAKLIAKEFELPGWGKLTYRDKDRHNVALYNLKREFVKRRLTNSQRVYILETLKAKKCRWGSVSALAEEFKVHPSIIRWYRNKYFSKRGRVIRKWKYEGS